MELVTKKRLQLFSGRSNLPLAEEIAKCLDVKLGEANLSEFANGELHCRFGESVRGSDVFIMQSHARPVNTSIMEQAIMIDDLQQNLLEGAGAAVLTEEALIGRDTSGLVGWMAQQPSWSDFPISRRRRSI